MLREIWLVHPEEEMCAAFRERFAGLPNVRVVRGRFEDLEPHDCFVTAGNAFGIMIAGIDAAVVRFFGEQLMQRIQHRIMDEFLGEQPVGTAFIEPTGNPDYPFLAHAPTMRVPGSIEGTDKVYSATWAALLAVHGHNVRQEHKIEAEALPAMGTGFGGVPFDEAARQMAAAYRHYLDPPHRVCAREHRGHRQGLLRDLGGAPRRSRAQCSSGTQDRGGGICYDGSRKVL